uniref:Uncharacterized protein n=1 Tax=Timema tahoe TaxID=61484 RepID=A0A7R9IF82_9NEOP|nr:unnamed protein product [Timema tahoe]
MFKMDICLRQTVISKQWITQPHELNILVARHQSVNVSTEFVDYRTVRIVVPGTFIAWTPLQDSWALRAPGQAPCCRTYSHRYTLVPRSLYVCPVLLASSNPGTPNQRQDKSTSEEASLHHLLVSILAPVYHLLVSVLVPFCHLLVSVLVPVHHLLVSVLVPVHHLLVSVLVPVHHLLVSVLVPVHHLLVSVQASLYHLLVSVQASLYHLLVSVQASLPPACVCTGPCPPPDCCLIKLVHLYLCLGSTTVVEELFPCRAPPTNQALGLPYIFLSRLTRTDLAGIVLITHLNHQSLDVLT